MPFELPHLIWPPRDIWSYPDLKELLVAGYDGPVPKSFFYQFPGDRWRGPVSLQRNEIMLDSTDPVWSSMTFSHQNEVIREVTRLDGLNLLWHLEPGQIRYPFDGMVYRAKCWWLVFDTVDDVLLFKLKWPGKVITSNK